MPFVGVVVVVPRDAAKGGGAGGGQLPPQILEDQIVPQAAVAHRLSTCPPRFLDLALLQQ